MPRKARFRLRLVWAADGEDMRGERTNGSGARGDERTNRSRYGATVSVATEASALALSTKPMAPGVSDTNFRRSSSFSKDLGAVPPPVMARRRQWLLKALAFMSTAPWRNASATGPALRTARVTRPAPSQATFLPRNTDFTVVASSFSPATFLLPIRTGAAKAAVPARHRAASTRTRRREEIFMV